MTRYLKELLLVLYVLKSVGCYLERLSAMGIGLTPSVRMSRSA